MIEAALFSIVSLATCYFARGRENTANVNAAQQQQAKKIKHLYTASEFTRQDILKLCESADWFKGQSEDMEGRVKLLEILKGRVIALLFYEPSTRTCCSFHSAALRLGASVINVDVAHSSVQKGETLQDTLRTLEQYADAVVMRHNEKGVFQRMIPFVNIPLLSGGDGSGEHPTQALLDVFTVLQHKKKIDGLVFTMIGDLKYGRTVHSLTKLLSRFDNIKINYVSPAELSMPSECLSAIADRVTQVEYTELTPAIIAETDVLYVTRVQKERFTRQEDFDAVKDIFVVNAKTLEHAKKDMIVMHPLPRVNELHEEVDQDPRCVYFDQMRCGVFMRMAIMNETFI
jgi:aspartate carbamoyltransferase